MSRSDDPSGDPSGEPSGESPDESDAAVPNGASRPDAGPPAGGPAADRPPPNLASSNPWARGADAIGAALTFAIAVGLFTTGGWWLDGKLGTSPLLLIVGAALGLLGGFLYLVKTLAPEALPWTAPRDGGADGPDRARPPRD